MKKIALSLLYGALMCVFVMPVMAQELAQKRKTAVFSPAMVTGAATPVQKGQIQETLPKAVRTTILRFEPGQLELSEVQKELLLNVARQVNGMYSVPMVIAVGASKNINDARIRVTQVERFLNAYISKRFEFGPRFIAPENVVRSVDNTVKITINR